MLRAVNARRRVVPCPDGSTIVLVDAPIGYDATDRNEW
jgi:hypothetical protein